MEFQYVASKILKIQDYTGIILNFQYFAGKILNFKIVPAEY